MTPEQLQQLYETALLNGHADFNNQRYSVEDIEAIAKRREIELKPITF